MMVCPVYAVYAEAKITCQVESDDIQAKRVMIY